MRCCRDQSLVAVASENKGETCGNKEKAKASEIAPMRNSGGGIRAASQAPIIIINKLTRNANKNYVPTQNGWMSVQSALR